MKIKANIPNAITSLNLISGCAAIVMALSIPQEFAGIPALVWCYIFIGAAAVFDFCDGFAARLLHAYSDLGKQLDSLCDLVSFGVAPAAMIFRIMTIHTDCIWLCCVAALIPVMGAVRLARFNISEEQTAYFTGLPIPANAIFWIGMAGWIERYCYPGTPVMILLIVLVSLSMVSNMHLFSLKFKNLDFHENFRRYALIVAAIAFVAFYGVSGLVWTIVLYFLLSLLSRRQDK